MQDKKVKNIDPLWALLALVKDDNDTTKADGEATQCGEKCPIMQAMIVGKLWKSRKVME